MRRRRSHKTCETPVHVPISFLISLSHLLVSPFLSHTPIHLQFFPFFFFFFFPSFFCSHRVACLFFCAFFFSLIIIVVVQVVVALPFVVVVASDRIYAKAIETYVYIYLISGQQQQCLVCLLFLAHFFVRKDNWSYYTQFGWFLRLSTWLDGWVIFLSGWVDG